MHQNYYLIQPEAIPSDRQGEINGINYEYSKNVLSKIGLLRFPQIVSLEKIFQCIIFEMRRSLPGKH